MRIRPALNVFLMVVLALFGCSGARAEKIDRVKLLTRIDMNGAQNQEHLILKSLDDECGGLRSSLSNFMHSGMLPAGRCRGLALFWLTNAVAGIDQTYVRTEIIERLIDAGVNPFESDPIGRLPFVYAVLEEKWDIANSFAAKAPEFGEEDFVCAMYYEYFAPTTDDDCDFGRYALDTP